MHHLYHKHLILTITLADPPATAEEVHVWLEELVEKIDMKILFGPFATRCDTEGNEGVTGVVCIETSHCSIHVWDGVAPAFAKFDLYSCKDFEVADVIAHFGRFSPLAVDYMVLDRNDGLKVAEQARIEF